MYNISKESCSKQLLIVALRDKVNNLRDSYKPSTSKTNAKDN